MATKLEIIKYWRKWQHSGTYNKELFLEEIFKEIEDKYNELVEEINNLNGIRTSEEA